MIATCFVRTRQLRSDAVALFERVSSEIPNVKTIGEILTAHDRMVDDFLNECTDSSRDPVQLELFELHTL